ncbi:MAG: calcium/proton exchanger [Solirubrobacteraceae bacterium]|nr:calcium/proton exchanger [Solirubrobacteraceae bacterium]
MRAVTRVSGFLFSGAGWPYLLVPFIPIAVALDLAGAGSSAIFLAAALGVVPTAALMGKATEELAARSGPGVGGLLNVTFGNAPELIIALFALNAGLQEVVKASLIGSVLGNTLLVLGGSMVYGGIGRVRQRFQPTAVTAQMTMLMLAGAALLMPTVFVLIQGTGLPQVGDEIAKVPVEARQMSDIVAVILLLSYGAGLLFSLRTHRDLFNPSHGDDDDELAAEDAWSVRRSVLTLAAAGVAVGVMSEILVGSLEDAAEGLGLSPFFIGLIVVAIVGNAAEHWVALYFAKKDKMDLTVNIAIGSGAQIALFVAPVLVLCSLFLGPEPMALVFNGYELAAILIAILAVDQVVRDGESTWFEGFQLLALYAIFGVVFFFA